MDRLLIQGGRPLFGRVAVSGAKNAALPIMAATLLVDGPVRLERVPQLGDVATMEALLAQLGVAIYRPTDDSLELLNTDTSRRRAAYRLVRRMRASVCVLGPLVARRGRGVVPLPGGCRLGDRPIDLHLRGLAALGAEIRIDRGLIVATARRLRGARIHLEGPRGPTVTGTANLLCAASLARGVTLLSGAASEPEIVDLGRFLNACGARITGLGTREIEIRGVSQLGGACWQLIPDRIEAATLLLAGLITRGVVTVERCLPSDLATVLEALAMLGAGVRTGPDFVTVDGRFAQRPGNFAAAPHPGLPTDVQPQLAACLAAIPGRSAIQDTVFPERFGHVAELNRFGAKLCRRGDTTLIEGTHALEAAPVAAPDLRAGASLVLAGLAARGATVVHKVLHVDRGYERFAEKLAALGANVERRGQMATAWSPSPRLPG